MAYSAGISKKRLLIADGGGYWGVLNTTNGKKSANTVMSQKNCQILQYFNP